MLRQRFLAEQGIIFTVLAMLLLMGIAAIILPRCGTRHWTDLLKGAMITGILFIACLVGGFIAFDRGYILDMLYPLLMPPFLYVSSVLAVIVIEQSDKQFVKELFGRYVSQEVAAEIINSADLGALQLGGEERDATVFFADIRHFTTLSEQMSPEAIVDMLNRYLGVIIDAILKNKGMINKFAGDNVMAVWNAPQLQNRHAEMAVKAAWEAQQELVRVQESDDSLPKVQFGIGVNTGTVLAGNVGSVGRAEYTVIGDSVNLAARICGTAPGGQVWIGPETYQQAIDSIDVEVLEPQSFKGKTERVAVYHVTGWRK
jgi:class 3 adenylate cyclase